MKRAYRIFVSLKLFSEYLINDECLFFTIYSEQQLFHSRCLIMPSEGYSLPRNDDSWIHIVALKLLKLDRRFSVIMNIVLR